MLGFDTIGSATLIVYDDEPVLSTDAWINDSAYFGSWTHDYHIPAEQMDAIRRARFHWFSHGHPDHLNTACLPELSAGKILLADHYGSRIARELREAGFEVQVLKDWQWVRLSPNVQVCSIANQNQDSILLVDVGGRLVIDANDSPEFGEAWRIRRLARRFKETYLLQLHGWGGADMLNLFAPDGRKLTSPEDKKRPIAPRAQRAALAYGATRVIPFSSFHRYRRTDSAWANELVPELADYQSNARPDGPTMLPAFVRVDCETDSVTPLEPSRVAAGLVAPEACGDDWSEPLGREDRQKIQRYFKSRTALCDHFGFVEVRIGGVTETVDLNPARTEVGVSFEAPRQSFMTCIDYEIFDDLLIGNFMRTTLHGVDSLYPHFTPYVAKYGDNGGAKSKRELAVYFGHYFMRDPAARLVSKFADASEQTLRKLMPEDGRMFRAAKRLYYAARTR